MADPSLRPEGLQPHRSRLCGDDPQGAGHDGGPRPMCWRRRAWTPMAAMSLCRGTATAWTCIMAATISPIRTGSLAPCRATGPRTWPRIMSSADPAQSYAERRGITFRERVAEIVRKVVPEKLRSMFDGLRPSAEASCPARTARGGRKERSAGKEGGGRPGNSVAARPEPKALVRHARAVDAIFQCRTRAARPARSR